MVRNVRKHELLGMKKVCMVRPACELAAWSRHAAFTFFNIYKLQKKIASNYLWLQCTVCRDYKQATRTMRKHRNFKKSFKST